MAMVLLLPPEVLTVVLLHLHPDAVWRECRLVCRQWHALLAEDGRYFYAEALALLVRQARAGTYPMLHPFGAEDAQGTTRVREAADYDGGGAASSGPGAVAPPRNIRKWYWACATQLFWSLPDGSKLQRSSGTTGSTACGDKGSGSGRISSDHPPRHVMSTSPIFGWCSATAKWCRVSSAAGASPSTSASPSAVALRKMFFEVQLLMSDDVRLCAGGRAIVGVHLSSIVVDGSSMGAGSGGGFVGPPQPPGDVEVTYGYVSASGAKCHSNVTRAYGPPFTHGDIIGVLVDADVAGGIVVFYHNGRCLGPAYEGVFAAGPGMAAVLTPAVSLCFAGCVLRPSALVPAYPPPGNE